MEIIYGNEYEEEQFKYDEQYTVKPLWNPKWLFVLAVLFSHVPVCVFYIVNYHRLNEKRLRDLAIIIFTLLTVVIFAGGFLWPSVFLKLSFGISIGTGLYMKLSQENLYKNHIEMGGAAARLLLPVVLSIVFGAIILFIQIYAKDIPDQSKAYFDDDLYYTSNVSIEDVEKLGEYLSNGLFKADSNEISVKLDIKNQIYEVSFIIKKEYMDDVELNGDFSLIREELEQYVFTESPVVICITDSQFKEFKRISD